MAQTVVVERAKAEDRRTEAQEAESTTADRSSRIGGFAGGRKLP
jgi:hypothetical protein